jgi:hypothetical protein
MIDIRSTNGNFFAESKNMLERVKERCLKFLEFIDEENDHAYDIQRSTSVEDVIDVFSEWYFSQYVYKHKEAFLDLFEFINNNLDKEVLIFTLSSRSLISVYFKLWVLYD